MMSAILGIFSRHLVTKFVALLLAIVLFVFTQQGISDTQLIKEINIHFELSPEASNPGLNFFGISASKPLSYWRDKGWIHRDDAFFAYLRYDDFSSGRDG